MTENPVSKNNRAGDNEMTACLVVLPRGTNNLGISGLFESSPHIYFPAMPDVIDLVREAEYYYVPSMIAPDGLHQYKHTKYLEIPITFKLHYMDPYCNEGSKSLLDIAAKLHSLTLPENTVRGGNLYVTVKPATPSSGTRPEGDVQDASQSAARLSVAGASSNGFSVVPPPACWLKLMGTRDDSVGVSCIGYVRNVKASLKKPWLRSVNGAFNMPTSAEYSFTFVHRPSHMSALSGINSGVTDSSKADNWNISNQEQTLGDVVDSMLYNTKRRMVSKSN